ncbi:uncharacterized protein FA14DRAFT_171267 [Meira miltonrushii]|uniref:DASH complex subunit DAD1 n=1 Tax=Meira miltonrushii TaxID=1280837 RepID=A0A316VAE4_9BASI|nr:uncharacterized protein FA14DRAFT_171267 [Meira miltonrushii]PWN34486.1 hypothetical protein FA14DRAFT_171267 [Meira miltonrushii]
MASTSKGNSANMAALQRSGSGSAPSPFFLKERERLITDIADGMEQLLGNVNTLNRKLEESVVVGQEFEPISNLWGPFVDMLTDHGIKPTKPSGTNEAGLKSSQTDDNPNAEGQQRLAGSLSAKELAESTAALSASLDGPNGNRLPPGVAPGGGTVYGMPSSSASAD